MRDLVHWLADTLGFTPEEWLMIHAFIFAATALVIWRQLTTVSRNSSIESFMKINNILSDIEIRRLRRELYLVGSQIEISKVRECVRLIKKKQEGKNINEECENKLNNIKPIIYAMNAYIDSNGKKDEVQKLIVIFDTMGIMLDKGRFIKEVMLDMYWDVIIKCWDCLFPIVKRERDQKIDAQDEQDETEVSKVRKSIAWLYVST